MNKSNDPSVTHSDIQFFSVPISVGQQFSWSKSQPVSQTVYQKDLNIWSYDKKKLKKHRGHWRTALKFWRRESVKDLAFRGPLITIHIPTLRVIQAWCLSGLPSTLPIFAIGYDCSGKVGTSFRRPTLDIGCQISAAADKTIRRLTSSRTTYYHSSLCQPNVDASHKKVFTMLFALEYTKAVLFFLSTLPSTFDRKC